MQNITGDKSIPDPLWTLPYEVQMLVAAGLPETPLLWALCLALGVVVPRCRQLTRRSIAACAKTVATYSYGIYLTHALALGLAFPNGGAVTLLQCAILVVLLPGLAALVYHSIEKPGILFGQKLARRLALKRPIRTGAEPG